MFGTKLKCSGEYSNNTHWYKNTVPEPKKCKHFTINYVQTKDANSILSFLKIRIMTFGWIIMYLPGVLLCQIYENYMPPPRSKLYLWPLTSSTIDLKPLLSTLFWIELFWSLCHKIAKYNWSFEKNFCLFAEGSHVTKFRV